jgi:hypothetical protein
MKKKTFYLLVIAAILTLSSCGEKEVLYDDLRKKGGEMYLDGQLFTGVAFIPWNSGNLKYEIHYKDGLKNGLKIKWTNEWPDDRMKIEEYMYVNGKEHGTYKNYLLEDDDGEEITEEIVEYENEYSNGVLIKDNGPPQWALDGPTEETEEVDIIESTIIDDGSSENIVEEENSAEETVIAEPEENINSTNRDEIKYGNINDPDGYTNVRKGKSSKSEILFQIYENEKFIIQNNEGDWWLIEFNGNQGYIHNSRVSIIN